MNDLLMLFVNPVDVFRGARFVSLLMPFDHVHAVEWSKVIDFEPFFCVLILMEKLYSLSIYFKHLLLSNAFANIFDPLGQPGDIVTTGLRLTIKVLVFIRGWPSLVVCVVEVLYAVIASELISDLV